MTGSMVTPIDGVAPERDVARDLVRRGLKTVPLWLLLCGVIWGWPGVASAAYAFAIVALNFLVAAGIMTATARISLGVMMAGVLGGYLFRLAVILVAVLLVIEQPWIDPVALGISIIVTHLGLLFWETRYVSASLAFPGLKPASKDGR